MNKAFLIGSVGKEPEIIRLENGNQVAKFSLATNESYKNKLGEKVTETTWHNIVVYGSLSKIVESYVNKGDKLCIEGKINNRTWETKDGEKKSNTEIVVSQLELLGSKPQSKDETFVSKGDDDLPF